jgi:hypothetical protein
MNLNTSNFLKLRSGDLRVANFTWHMEGKLIGLDQKNNAKRKAPNLENQ